MLNDEIRSWVERVAGGRVVAAERPPTGGSRDLYLVDLEQPDGARRALDGQGWRKRREQLRRLGGAPVVE